MIKKFLIVLFVLPIFLNGCASSSSNKVSLGGKQRTVDFCSSPSDIGTALACEVVALGASAAIGAASDAYGNSKRKKNSITTSEKNLLLDLSDDQVCRGAFGGNTIVASHKYVASHRRLDCLSSYSDTNLCNELLKKRKLIKISNHTETSTKIKIFEDEVEKRQIECD